MADLDPVDEMPMAAHGTLDQNVHDHDYPRDGSEKGSYVDRYSQDAFQDLNYAGKGNFSHNREEVHSQDREPVQMA